MYTYNSQDRIVCNKCGIPKPPDAFYIADKHTGRRRGTCINCLSHKNGAPPPPPPATVKTCTKCGVEKPVEEFPYKNRLLGKRHSVCSDCSSKRANEWYYENRERHIDNVNQIRSDSREAARNYVAEYLLSHPCVDCGESNPNKLEFDHQSGKDFSVTHMIYKGFSVAHIATEISKCKVRCANCHRRKTASERGWFRGR
jgi:hypothetical protein